MAVASLIQRDDIIGSLLPDAAAWRTGAYAWHRRGLTGTEVRVALVDAGIRTSSWFAERWLRVEGDESHLDNEHGTAMASIVLSVAPDATVQSFPVGHDPEGALHRACEAPDVHIVMAAWGIPRLRCRQPTSPVPMNRVITVRAAPEEWPGGDPEAAQVTSATVWPQGPFRCPAVRRPFAGLSVATALVAGFACLLIGNGSDPAEALNTLVRSGPLPPPNPAG